MIMEVGGREERSLYQVIAMLRVLSDESGASDNPDVLQRIICSMAGTAEAAADILDRFACGFTQLLMDLEMGNNQYPEDPENEENLESEEMAAKSRKRKKGEERY